MSNFARLSLIAWFGQGNQFQVLFSELNSILTVIFFFLSRQLERTFQILS